jgi:hypothetical protein
MTHRILLFLAAVAAAAQVPVPRTLRLDYVHTGMAAEEHFALDGVVLEGAWPGPLDRWTDESNLGTYYFQVLDRATNRVVYSRGFASIYGEWETTGEAKEQRRRAIRAQKRPEADMEALFREEGGLATRMLGSGGNAGKVGAFEGAMYEGRGYYRPQQDCIMFTRDEVGFCAVCRRAIERVIRMYAK